MVAALESDDDWPWINARLDHSENGDAFKWSMHALFATVPVMLLSFFDRARTIALPLL